VTVLARRAPAITHDKLETIILPSDEYPKGFDAIPDSLVEQLRAKGSSAVVWALGVSQRDVDKDTYVSSTLAPLVCGARVPHTRALDVVIRLRLGPTDPRRITYDYTVEAARAFSTLGTADKPFRFVFVSGMGADQTEKSRPIFAKIKGRAEKWLVEHETESFKTVNLRPGGIVPTPEHAKNVPFVQKAMITVSGWLLPSLMIQSTDLAKASVELAAGKVGDAR
jgi:hypothetical protein